MTGDLDGVEPAELSRLGRRCEGLAERSTPKTSATMPRSMFSYTPVSASVSILGYAVVCGELDANPVREVRKPARRAKRVVRPLTPEQVEEIRARLELRDATLVSVLAYAGPRPAEALKLAWRDARDRTLVIEPANSKTGRERTVR